MSWTELLGELPPLRQQLDKATAAFCRQEVSAVPIFCANGCCNCCSLAVNCSFPEAVAIAAVLTAEQQQQLESKILLLREISQQANDLKQFLRLFRQKIAGCPLLDRKDGSCSIYSERPLSCRALLSTRNSSWCGVDFGELHPLEREAFLSSLDPNVAAFPTHYLAATQELGMELEIQLLSSMRETFGFALSGNLLYQLWLERKYRLSEIIPQGFAATRNGLEERQLDLPFLLQLQGE